MIKISTAEKIIFSFLLFIGALLIMRIVYSNNLRYIFLMWNLFLAWIPFQLAVVLTLKPHFSKWKQYILLAGWLLFFPNALYIITDLVHLENSGNDVPVWFDVLLLFTSSVTGLLMAFISLYHVEVFIRRNITATHVNKIIAASIFLGSFGVYVGRFLRWNSWDILANPVSLLIEVMARFANPVVHYRTWAVTFLLTCLFCLLYYGIKSLPLLLSESTVTVKDK
jgi:uncharacterized membrane protein